MFAFIRELFFTLPAAKNQPLRFPSISFPTNRNWTSLKIFPKAKPNLHAFIKEKKEVNCQIGQLFRKLPAWKELSKRKHNMRSMLDETGEEIPKPGHWTGMSSVLIPGMLDDRKATVKLSCPKS